MRENEYIKELAGVVALPDRMSCSLLNFAIRIKIQIENELDKFDPDNSLIAVLADAARLGWEQIESNSVTKPSVKSTGNRRD